MRTGWFFCWMWTTRLLDNDRFAADLGDRLEQAFGASERARYWAIFAPAARAAGPRRLSGQPAGVSRRARRPSGIARHVGISAGISLRGAAVPARPRGGGPLGTLGRPAVLSDGDIVFQPRKIQRSGIWDAVEGRVMIYLHKERVLDHMQQRYPAKHYVMVDDKPNLLAAMKSILEEKLTTVFVRQGHYALAPESNTVSPPPDMTIERIGDLMNHNLSAFQEPT